MVHEVTSSPFTLVMPQDHPLAHRKAVDFAELATEPFVSLSEGFVHTKALAWFTAAAGIQPSIVYRTPDVTLLKQMIHARVGIGLLTKMAVTASDHLATVPLTNVGQPQFLISVVTRRGQVFSPAMQQLLHILN
jgi:DNA-binding transcriptional LysR family regulator